MVSYYVTYLQEKIPNSVYCEHLEKTFPEMTYHVRGFMAFGSNDQCYGQNHGLVCDNVPILYTSVHLGMANNVAGGSFSFRRTKNAFSIFRVLITGSFVKQPPNESFKMLSSHFSKILDHVTWTMSQPGYLKPFGPPVIKKTNVRRIDRKWVRFVLQVHDLMSMIF